MSKLITPFFPPLTKTLVRELFDYEQVTGTLIWKFPLSNKVKVGEAAGCVDKYSRVKIANRSYKVHRIIFLFHHGWLPPVVDHINRNKLDNRIENLRSATCSENAANYVNNKEKNKYTSIYRGVFQEKSGAWLASVYKNGKRVYRKRFSTELEAALAYDQVSISVHGEFAVRNLGGAL